MSLQPIWPLWLIAIFAVALGALCVWQLLRTGTNRLGWERRLGIVALMTIIGLGPSIEDRVPVRC